MVGLIARKESIMDGSQEVGQVADVSSAPVSNNSPPEVSQPQSGGSSEKLLKQSEVNEIVGREKKEAVERYKREMSSTSQPQQSPQSLSQDDVKRMAAEEVERLRNEYQQDALRTAQEQEAKRIASDFFTKLEANKDKYPDLPKAMADIDLPSYGNAVQLAASVENTADVWNHLVNDPVKLEAINLMAARSPKAAIAQIKRLSESLKENEQAGNFKLPNEPLSKLKPSNTGMDTGAMSVSDYRKKYRI